MLRGPCVLVITPNPPPSVRPGELKMGWFVRSIKSPRNWSFLLSPTGKSFCTLRSRLPSPGLRTIPFPQLPNVPLNAASGVVSVHNVGRRHAIRAHRKHVPEARSGRIGPSVRGHREAGAGRSKSRKRSIRRRLRSARGLHPCQTSGSCRMVAHRVRRSSGFGSDRRSMDPVCGARMFFDTIAPRSVRER